MTENYFFVLLSVYFGAYNPREILPEIINYFVSRMRYGNGLHYFVRAHGRTAFRCNLRVYFYLFYACFTPSYFSVIYRCVKSFAVVKVRLAHGTLAGNLPAFVGADYPACTVRIFDAQFKQKRLSFRRYAVFSRKHERAHRPTAGNGCQKLALAFKHFRNVVSPILQSGFIRCKAGGEIIVSHLFIVYFQPVNTQSRRINNRSFNGFFKLYFFTKNKRNGRNFLFFKAIFAVRYPLCPPTIIKFSSFERGFRKVAFAVIVGGGHAYLILGVRL